jgi:hypothetical protein
MRVAGNDPRRSYSIGLEVIAPELLKEFIMEDIGICSEMAWKVLKDDDAVEESKWGAYKAIMKGSTRNTRHVRSSTFPRRGGGNSRGRGRGRGRR